MFTVPLRRFLEAGPGYSHRDVEWQPGLPYRCAVQLGAEALQPDAAVPPLAGRPSCQDSGLRHLPRGNLPSPLPPRSLHYFEHRHGGRSFTIWGLTAGMLVRALAL